MGSFFSNSSTPIEDESESDASDGESSSDPAENETTGKTATTKDQLSVDTADGKRKDHSPNRDSGRDELSRLKLRRETIDKRLFRKFRKRDLNRWATSERLVVNVKYKDHPYQFENLVFEGGGAKGYSYIGALQVMEEIGLTKQLRRFAGASIGCVPAAFCAVGCTSQDLADFFNFDASYAVYDNSWGYLSLIPNIVRKFGWLPCKRIEKLFGDVIERKTGSPDTTFKQLYDKTGRELCIPLTNLGVMTTYYAHVKTTPNMPIKTAMRLTTTVPGFVEPLKYTLDGQTDYYVDGGITCNFPIFAYDGWWLSMKPEDSFFRRLRPISQAAQLMEQRERFGAYNEKTLGLLVFSNDESDPFQDVLESRRGAELPVKLPNTALYRKFRQHQKLRRRTAKDHKTCVKAIDAFFAALDLHGLDDDHTISLRQWRDVFNDERFKKEHSEYLFGPDVTADEAFEQIIDSDSEEISFHNLYEFMVETGIDFNSQLFGHRRRTAPINSFTTFLVAVQETLASNIEHNQIHRIDINRTVGINTGYILSQDLTMEPDDKAFLIEQGRRSMTAFLRYYAMEKHLSTVAEQLINYTKNENAEI